MRLSTILVPSILAAIALAAPQRPGQFHRRPNWPVSLEECAAVSTTVSTTTAYVTVTESFEAISASASSTGIASSVAGTSSTVSADPITSSASVITVDTTTSSAYSTVTVTYTANTSLPLPGPTGTEIAPVPSQCLTSEDADGLADVFRMLIQDYSSELALDALTEDFVDYSSSVNILINGGAQYPKNITAPTFDGRAAFMAGQGSQPKIPFTTLNIFHGCDSVSVRWLTSRSGNGQPTEAAMIPVVGNAIIYAVPASDSSYGWRIKVLYSEFNAAAWLVNLGVFMPEGPVDYLTQANATNSTTKRSTGSFNPGLRGAII